MTTPGLFIVGTPIGNLADLTSRARETLEHASVVAAEDTRRSRQLLSYLGLSKKRLVCIDAHATRRQIDQVLDEIEGGATVALVTDAGMPSVSDPGSRLVAACRARGLPLSVVPGPSAVTAAVALSGLADDGFWFLGFLPRKGEKRWEALEQIADFEQAVVFFESPKRMTQTLADIAEIMPARLVCATRELTKRFEEAVVMQAQQFAQAPRDWLGEVTVVIAPRAGAPRGAADDEDVDALIQRRLNLGQSARSVSEALAPLLRIPRRAIYQRTLQLAKPEES